MSICLNSIEPPGEPTRDWTFSGVHIIYSKLVFPFLSGCCLDLLGIIMQSCDSRRGKDQLWYRPDAYQTVVWICVLSDQFKHCIPQSG